MTSRQRTVFSGNHGLERADRTVGVAYDGAVADIGPADRERIGQHQICNIGVGCGRGLETKGYRPPSSGITSGKALFSRV